MENKNEERFCRNVYCGKLLVRKEGEHIQNFKTRIFCGHSCANGQERRITAKKRANIKQNQPFVERKEMKAYLDGREK